MPIAIIIGFQYDFHTLPGAIIDIYHAYKWCQSCGYPIYVFTDITQITDTRNLKLAMERNIVKPDILTFYEDIPNKHIVSTVDSLTTGLQTCLSQISDDKLIVYYSGHGIKDVMVMPDKTLLNFVKFREAITFHLSPYTEIFCILDCCNPDGLHLPYKLINNSFMLSPRQITCITQPMLLITSANPDEKSVSTRTGSIFTSRLFSLLSQMNSDEPLIYDGNSITVPNKRNRNLKRLLSNLNSYIRTVHTGYTQTVSIYSSYVMDPILWMWVGSHKKYDIVTDKSLSILFLRNDYSISLSR